jgi:hypothetical protein
MSLELCVLATAARPETQRSFDRRPASCILARVRARYARPRESSRITVLRLTGRHAQIGHFLAESCCQINLMILLFNQDFPDLLGQGELAERLALGLRKTSPTKPKHWPEDVRPRENGRNRPDQQNRSR